MEIAKVHVSGILAGTVYCKPIPAGVVGATVRFEYADPLWDGLTKAVVFKGACTKDVLNAGEVVNIPPELVAIKGTRLVVGIYGTDAQNNLVIPTLWADLGVVLPATAPSGDTSTDPSLPVWAQLEAMIGDLTQLDTEAKSSLVAAINESMKYSGDSIDEATLREMVDDYLAANPPAAGTPGQDGGYYTPSVTQPDEGTVEFNFTPSREGMPEVPGQSVTLPAGPGGSGIHVGTEEPEDEDIDIWVNPDGEPVNLMEAPKQAKVGQTIVVSAVDENGAPIAWEAVDFPSVPGTLPNPAALTFTGAVEATYDGSEAVNVEIPSGGSGESQWKLLASIELDEDVQSIHLTSDDSGNPFSCKEFVVQIAAVIRSSVSSIKFAKTKYRYDVPDISTSTVFMQLNAFGNTSGARYYVFRRTMEAGLNRTVFVDSIKDIFEEITGAAANGVYGDGTVFDTTLYDTAISDLLVYATNGFLTGDKIKIYGR